MLKWHSGKLIIALLLAAMVFAVTGGFSNAQSVPNWMCGQDLNNDGDMAQPGEVTSCITNTKGQLCPLGAVDCIIKTTSSKCPPQAPKNESTGMCEVPPICPTSYSYDNSADACKKTVPASCSSSSAVIDPGVGMCQEDPLCKNTYTFDSSLNQCYAYSPYNCPVGTAYVSSTGKCSSLPTCQEGTYDPATNLCKVQLGQYLAYQCPSGAPLNAMDNKCEAAPICTPGSTFQQSTAQCIAYDAAFCAANDEILNGTTHKCEALPLCSIGKYSLADNQCVDAIAATCPSGGFLNADLDVCQAYPGCSLGNTLDPNGMCSSVGGITYPAICPKGAPTIDPTSHMCSTPIIYQWLPWLTVFDECIIYNSWSSSDTDNCVLSGIQIDTDGDGIYDSFPANTTGGMILRYMYTNNLKSLMAMNTNNYIAKTYVGSTPSRNIRIQVSDNSVPVPFTDLGTYSPVWDPAVSWSKNEYFGYGRTTWGGLPNHGYYGIRYEKRSAPICPSYTTPNIASSNCEALPTCGIAADGSAMLFDPTINACISYAKLCSLNSDSTQYACIDPGTGNPQCSPNPCVDLSASVPTDSTVNPPSYTNDGAVDSNGNCLGQLLIFNGKAGQCKPPGVQTNWFNCCNAANITDQAMSGSSFDTNVLDYFNTCGQRSAYAIAAINANRAHYVGEYCTDSWRFIGCVQHSKMYCDFPSRLGRIIAEQGRPQLQAFGPGGGWGTPQSPNCRGFRPDEFQMLDFSKMDLSEFTQTIQTNMVPQVQTQMNTGVQNFYNTIQ